MNKWVKFLAVPATLALLAGCGNGESGSEGASEETTTEETTTEQTSPEETTTEESSASEESSTSEESSEETDATSGASQVADSDELQTVLAEGPWIVLFQNDIETEEDLTMAGGFTNDEGEPSRKLGLYSTDEAGDVAETYTLTAPSITLQNEHTRIVNGTVAADVTVEANELQLEAGTIDGNLDFASQEYYDSANLEDGEVTGEITVEGQPVE